MVIGMYVDSTIQDKQSDSRIQSENDLIFKISRGSRPFSYFPAFGNFLSDLIGWVQPGRVSIILSSFKFILFSAGSIKYECFITNLIIDWIVVKSNKFLWVCIQCDEISLRFRIFFSVSSFKATLTKIPLQSSHV